MIRDQPVVGGALYSERGDDLTGNNECNVCLHGRAGGLAEIARSFERTAREQGRWKIKDVLGKCERMGIKVFLAYLLVYWSTVR